MYTHALRHLLATISGTLILVGATMAGLSQAATPYLPPDDGGPGAAPPARGAPPGTPRMARSHIVVELAPGADEARFAEGARRQGLRQLGRVYGTNWRTMAIPAATAPRAAAAAARALPGVVRATPDLRVEAFHHVPPVSPPYVNDPLYIYDDDPTTKPPCDPCPPESIVDQWGLFRVDAESGWNTSTGNGQVIIAVVDSGQDLDHDDLRDNLWTNPGEGPVPDGIDNDGNGFVDDLHGYDFVGANVGDPFLDDPSSQDPNPDIPDVGVWVEDFSAPWWWRFEGDPAAGDALDNNSDFLIDLGVFHGTFVAGIVAAATDNINPESGLYEGIAGACWNCRLMVVRMIDAEGGGLMSDAAAAIRYAADNGAHVINASWGVGINGLDPADVEIVRQAVDYAVGKGVIFVAAAGNSGTTGVAFPGAMANTIAVGASNWADDLSPFSSYGFATEIPDDGIDNDGNGWIDDIVEVVAPGELIWSTTVISAYEAFILNGWDWFCCADSPGPDDWYPGQDAYTRSDGTSFAAPLVAGHIGVLLSANCGAGLADVRQAIRDNALDVGPPGYDPQTGFGRMQFIVPTNLGSGDCGGDPGSNLAPVANAGADQQVIDRGRAGENVTLDGSASSDPDGSISAYVWREQGVVLASGATAVVPLGVGNHLITLTVTDNRGATATDDVLVQVCKKSCTGGDGPVAVDDAYQVATAGGSLSVAAPGVLENDSDPGGESLTAVLLSGPANATSFSLQPDGGFAYTHDGGTSTSDGFTYRAVNESGQESTAATVSIAIGAPPGDPDAMYMQNVRFETKGRALNVTVTVRRDSDADGLAESSDAAVGDAVVSGRLCSLAFPSICHFEGTPIRTGGNGQATYKLFGATGQYSYTWTDIQHPDYVWDAALDVDNPAVGP